MSWLECVLNIWVFLAIAAGASLMILINVIEAYILKRKLRRLKDGLNIMSDVDTINLQGLKTARHARGKNKTKNKNKNKSGN